MANITFTEGSGLQDSIFGKSQEPIKMFLEKRGEAFEQASMLPELFNISPSNHWGEKFTTMTAMEGFQPVGENLEEQLLAVARDRGRRQADGPQEAACGLHHVVLPHA